MKKKKLTCLISFTCCFWNRIKEKKILANSISKGKKALQAKKESNSKVSEGRIANVYFFYSRKCCISDSCSNRHIKPQRKKPRHLKVKKYKTLFSDVDQLTKIEGKKPYAAHDPDSQYHIQLWVQFQACPRG